MTNVHDLRNGSDRGGSIRGSRTDHHDDPIIESTAMRLFSSRPRPSQASAAAAGTRNALLILVGLLTFALATSATVPSASAQITVDSDVVTPVRNGVFRSTTYDALSAESAATILAATGADQVFDFTALTFAPTEYTLNVRSTANGTPGEDDPAFDDANFVTYPDRSVLWTFHELTSDHQLVLGSIQLFDVTGDGVDDTTYIYNDPPGVEWEFPVEFGDSWGGTFVQTTTFPGGELQSTVTDEVVVDAWGELRTPSGTADAIRAVRTRTQESPFVTTVIKTYTYLTNDGLVASIVEANGTVSVVQYSVFGEGSTASEESPSRTFHLAPAYPNPFTTTASIAFTLDAAGPVRLQVYDLLGREVARLADEVLPSGWHERVFSRAGLADGVYLVRITVDGASSTQRVVVRR